MKLKSHTQGPDISSLGLQLRFWPFLSFRSFPVDTKWLIGAAVKMVLLIFIQFCIVLLKVYNCSGQYLIEETYYLRVVGPNTAWLTMAEYQ